MFPSKQYLSPFFFSFYFSTASFFKLRGESIKLLYLGEVEGENGFKVYLISSTVFFAEYFL